MIERTKEEMADLYLQRRKKAVACMNKCGVNVALFESTEGRRDPMIRYFTGFASDALFILDDSGSTVLVAWDENLARRMAVCDKVISSSKFGRQNIRAAKELLGQSGVVELPPSTPYPLFLKYVDALEKWDVRCREDGVHKQLLDVRSIKDDYEIQCIKAAAHAGDIILDEIEEAVRTGGMRTEAEAAIFIESECRKQGCERTGFETLAAGPERSFAIHCFPSFTNGTLAGDGLSIIDFGVVCDGYTSDMTATIAKGHLTNVQENMIKLVQSVYDECRLLYSPDVPIKEAACKADRMFLKAGFRMPHSLGHGIGLDVHEAPFVKATESSEKTFQAGMVVTLEPGLYDEAEGGVRLENDVHVTETGFEVISHSRIIRL